MKIVSCAILSAALFGGGVLFANDDVAENLLDSPAAVARWINGKEMQFLLTGGPKNGPAVKIIPADAKGMTCGYPLNVAKIRGKVIQVSADIKGENISKPAKPYLGVKLMLTITADDGIVSYLDIPIDQKKIGTFDWTTYKVPARIPENVKSVQLGIGLQEATGSVYFSNLDVEIEE